MNKSRLLTGLAVTSVAILGIGTLSAWADHTCTSSTPSHTWTCPDDTGCHKCTCIKNGETTYKYGCYTQGCPETGCSCD